MEVGYGIKHNELRFYSMQSWQLMGRIQQRPSWAHVNFEYIDP